MKKIITLAALLVAACKVSASENPDRYPSVGLTYTETHVAAQGGGSFISERPFILDVRVPVSDNVTIGFHGGPSTFATSFNSTRTAYSIGASARIYLPWKLVRE